MQKKFNSSEVLVLEADIDMPIKQQVELVKKIMLPKNKPLNTYMTETEFADFKSYLLDTLKIKKSKFNKILKIKPIFSTALILGEQLDKPTVYEKELSKEAKKRKMLFKTLETLDFQVGIFEKISVEEQVKMVFGKKQDISLTGYNEMLSAYKAGDLNKVSAMTNADTSFTKFREEFLTDRNAAWIPKIDEIIKKQSAFIAVGTAHLPGEQGVIALLRKRGYTVKPLK
jgi:uncharacterized protein YbaP (TraB family)